MRLAWGNSPVRVFIACWVAFIFVVDPLSVAASGRLALSISLRAVAWVSDFSLAPLGQSFVVSGWEFLMWFSCLAPWAASLSASLFPQLPAWPFIHSKLVGWGLALRALTVPLIRLLMGEFM